MSTVDVLPVAHDDRHEVDVMVGAKVRGKMAERRVPQAEIAAVLGLKQQSVSKRLAGTIPFEYGELWLIARYLRQPSVAAMLAEVDSPPQGPGHVQGQSAGTYTDTARRVLDLFRPQPAPRQRTLVPLSAAA